MTDSVSNRSVIRVERDFHQRVTHAANQAGQSIRVYVQRNLQLPPNA